MIRPPSPRRVASWTPVATLPASSSQRAVNIDGTSRPYFGLHSPKVGNFKVPKVSGQGQFVLSKNFRRNNRLGSILDLAARMG